MMLSDYVKDSKFNPQREINKERFIKDFFQQKQYLLNEYLENEDDNHVPKPIRTNVVTAIMKSRKR